MLPLGNSLIKNALSVLILALILIGSLVACAPPAPTSGQPSSPKSSLTSSVVIDGTPTFTTNGDFVVVTVTYRVPTLNDNDVYANQGSGLVLICYIGRGTSSDPPLYQSSSPIAILNAVTVATTTTINIPKKSAGLTYSVWCALGNVAISNTAHFTIDCPVNLIPHGNPDAILYDPCGSDAIPTDTPTTTSGTGTDPYYIFSIKASGPNIVVGTQSDVAKPSCNFTDGGVCHDGDANVQVFETLGGPYDTLDQATQAYCQMVTNVRPYFGGYKGTINGKDYWLDNAPACS